MVLAGKGPAMSAAKVQKPLRAIIVSRFGASQEMIR